MLYEVLLYCFAVVAASHSPAGVSSTVTDNTLCGTLSMDQITSAVVFRDAGQGPSTAAHVSPSEQPDEIIVFEMRQDDRLRVLFENAQSVWSALQSLPLEAIRAVAMVVSVFMGGCFVPQSSNTSGDGVLGWAESLGRQLRISHHEGIPVGLLHHGNSRHRAVCFKWICDRLEIPCSLSWAADYQTSGRCFNTVCLEGASSPAVVDCMQSPQRMVQARGQ